MIAFTQFERPLCFVHCIQFPYETSSLDPLFFIAFQSGPQHIIHFNWLFKLSVFTLRGLYCSCTSNYNLFLFYWYYYNIMKFIEMLEIISHLIFNVSGETPTWNHHVVTRCMHVVFILHATSKTKTKDGINVRFKFCLLSKFFSAVFHEHLKTLGDFVDIKYIIY